MWITNNHIDYRIKLSAAVLVFGIGAALSAVAQTPALSLPPLPTTPEAPKLDAPKAPSSDINKSTKDKVDTKTIVAPKPEAAPTADATGDAAQKNQKKEAAGAALPTVPKMPPSDDSAGFGKQAADGTPVLPNVVVQTAKTPSPVLGLPLPLPPDSSGNEISLKLDSKGKSAATSDNPPTEAEDKPKPKSWQTKLAPTAKIPKLGYNYKRVVLPDLVYQPQYSHENMHLPPRMTREDYGALLFKSIAKSDLEVMRALLNAGTPTSITNEHGETPLAFAERIGDERAVALLNARDALR